MHSLSPYYPNAALVRREILDMSQKERILLLRLKESQGKDLPILTHLSVSEPYYNLRRLSSLNVAIVRRYANTHRHVVSAHDLPIHEVSGLLRPFSEAAKSSIHR
jgi:hypothetical protein